MSAGCYGRTLTVVPSGTNSQWIILLIQTNIVVILDSDIRVFSGLEGGGRDLLPPLLGLALGLWIILITQCFITSDDTIARNYHH
jgi:hypothetical protein